MAGLQDIRATRIQVDVEQKRFTAHARRRQGRFTARMAAADDNNVIFPAHAFPYFLAVPQAI